MKLAALIVALLAAQAQAPPARDTRLVATGAAVIRGRVVAVETGRPLGLATITARASELPESRSISTNAEGRYELRDLPAGRYALSASRNGYLSMAYGQTRPREQGKPIQLAARQTIEDVDFAMPRAGAISGRVTDDQGDPLPWVRVTAQQSRFEQAQAAVADEQGRYRISNLGPGSYVVWTQVLDSWPGDRPGRALAFPQSFFPNTTNPSAAERIEIRPGSEVSNVNLSLAPAATATVSGTVVDSTGQPGVSAIQVSLVQQVEGFATFGFGAPLRNGRFTFQNVLPGAYTLVVSSLPRPGVGAEEAVVPLVVSGSDIDLAVATSTGWSVAGRVIVDGATGSVLQRDRVLLQAVPVIRVNAAMVRADGRVKEDGTFTISGIHGRARLIANIPDGWTVNAIRAGGRDVAGKPIEMAVGETLTGVEVVVSNRVTRLTGNVTDAAAAPVNAGTVIVFVDDRERWFDPTGMMRPGSTEFVRAARPDQQGLFEIKGMPPGNYLAVAVDYAPDRIWYDPSYLDSIRPYAQRVTIADGESKTLALKLVTP